MQAGRQACLPSRQTDRQTDNDVSECQTSVKTANLIDIIGFYMLIKSEHNSSDDKQSGMCVALHSCEIELLLSLNWNLFYLSVVYLTIASSYFKPFLIDIFILFTNLTPWALF